MQKVFLFIILSLSVTSLSAQPVTGCYWEWMNGNISKEGITKDLEYMKAVGIESAFIFDTWIGVERGPVDYGSKEWIDGPRDYAPQLTVEVSKDGHQWTEIGKASGVALKAHDIPIYFKCQATPCRYLRLTSNRGSNLDRIEILTAEGSGTTYRRVGYTTNGQMVTAAPESGLGLEVDKLSRKGVEAHFQRFLIPLLEELKEYCGNTLRRIVVDSWEAGRQDWTESLGVDYIQNGEGKDFYTGGIGKQTGTKNRLFMQEYLYPLKEMVNSYGLLLAGEPYGNGDFDREQYGISFDLPMSGYWARCHYGSIERPMFVSRYGHAAGRHIIGCEFGTAYPGDADIPATLSSFKDDIDKVCDAGVNFFVLHCVVHQDNDCRPLTMGPFGTRFDRLHANADSVRVLTDYIHESVETRKKIKK